MWCEWSTSNNAAQTSAGSLRRRRLPPSRAARASSPGHCEQRYLCPACGLQRAAEAVSVVLCTGELKPRQSPLLTERRQRQTRHRQYGNQKT